MHIYICRSMADINSNMPNPYFTDDNIMKYRQ